MLKRLELTNLGTHARTVINFGEGVNTIIGPSDSGKSWIIRGIEQLALNLYKGSDFIKHNQSETTIRGIFSDGVDITREKSKKDNNYILDGHTYKAGTGEPTGVIAQALNMKPINFFGQEESLFFLSMTPPQRGRYVNRLADIDVIDITSTNIASILRGEKKELDIAEEELKAVTKELKQYKGLEILEGKVEGARAAENLLLQRIREQRNLKETIKNIMKLRKEIKELPDVTALKKKIKSAENLWRSIEREIRKSKELKADIKDIEDTQNAVKDLENRWKKENKTFERMMPEVCPLCGAE